MEKLLWILKHDFFIKKIDGVFINPKYYKIPRRDFHKVRVAVEKLGLSVAWLTRSAMDGYDWYFTKKDADDIAGWLQYARTDV